MRPLLAALAALSIAGAAPAEDARVAALLPFVAHALEDASDRPLVVASVRASLHAPPAAGMDLGNPHDPNLEALVAARPTLVVADGLLHRRFSAELARGGAEILWLDTTSVASTLAGLRELGARVGVREAMDGRVVRVEDELAECALPAPVPVLALFGTPGSFYVITERAWIGDLLRRVGFALTGTEGASDERMPGFAPVSDEHLATLRPELVVLVAHGDPDAIRAGFLRQLEGGPWQGLRASARRGVHVLDGRLFGSNPGLDMPEAARALVALASDAPAGGAE